MKTSTRFGEDGVNVGLNVGPQPLAERIVVLVRFQVRCVVAETVVAAEVIDELAVGRVEHGRLVRPECAIANLEPVESGLERLVRVRLVMSVVRREEESELFESVIVVHHMPQERVVALADVGQQKVVLEMGFVVRGVDRIVLLVVDVHVVVADRSQIIQPVDVFLFETTHHYRIVAPLGRGRFLGRLARDLIKAQHERITVYKYITYICKVKTKKLKKTHAFRTLPAMGAHNG